MKKIIIALAAFAIVSCTSTSQETSKKETSETQSEEVSSDGVSFGNLKDGAIISSPFGIEMNVSGMEVEPKGAPRAGFGHHHLLINDGFTPEGMVIVADDTHIHYGGGQTSDSLALDPGTYKLTLQFADGMHVSYGEKWSQSISVTVE